MTDEMGELIPLSKFLKSRFKGDKTILCLFLLNKSQGTKTKFSPRFFRERTYDQLVDFAVKVFNGVGELGNGQNDTLELGSK